MPLKTLFLNPPSFENFDGGAGSRWPATREIESYWYPVWLAYPTGMIDGARLIDAPPHHISAEETINTAKQYEFLVLYTSTPGFPATRNRYLSPRLGRSALQRTFSSPSICFALHDAWVPGPVHVLLVAADHQRARLAQTFH